MRRLLLLVSAIMFADTLFYAALTPLLPHYAATLGLTKAGAGVLTAAFGAGTLLGSLPAGALAARVGPKPVVLLGYGLLTTTSLGFAFGDRVWLLDAARFLQGVGGACTWTGALAWLVASAPVERRGELIGTALGAGIGGALLGPLVGGAAALAGTAPVFAGVAIGAAAMAGIVGLAAAPPAARQSLAGLRAGFSERRVLGGMWLVALPAILFGMLSVLAPLRFHRLGGGAVWISAAFLLSAAVESVASPLVGRLSDRRGPAALIRVGAPASAAVAIAAPLVGGRLGLLAVIVAAGLAYGVFWVPAMTGLLSGVERLGLDASFAFALMNLSWASGQGLGSLGGGALGARFGDTVPYWAGAALCLATLAAARPRLVTRAEPA